MNQGLKEALDSEDDLGKVIRSHVVIETYLNRIIESKMVCIDTFKSIELEYSKTVQLAVALGLNPRFQTPLNTIGTLRNGFAHNLRPAISKQDVNNLYSSFSSEDKQVVQNCLKSTKQKIKKEKVPSFQELEPSDKFVLCVITICGALEIACKQAS